MKTFRAAPARLPSREHRWQPRHLAVGCVLALAIVILVSGSPSSGIAAAATSGQHERAAVHSSNGGHHPAHPRGARATRPGAGGLAALESGLLPWTMPQPISRAVAVPSGSTGVLVAGGLTTGDASSAKVSTVTVPGGSVAATGALATPTHDAAGAVVKGRLLVFGGGTQTTVATVQSFPLAVGGAPASGTVVGQMPQPRSDAAAVAIGRIAYVIGGYDGTNPDRQILSTANGTSFRVVGSLVVPVRYPAVAAQGAVVYVFGGQSIGGTGAPVDAVQRFDTRTGRVQVVAHLPQPLSAASAVNLGGTIYLAGGNSGAAESASIYAFDIRKNRLLLAGHLMAPVSNAAVTALGSTAWLIGGESKGLPQPAVQMFRPNIKFGLAGAPGAGSPYYGSKLLIADRGNNRLLLLDDTGQITWTYPNPPSMPPPPGPKGFYFPDDAFFINHGTAIISNQEENETIVKIGYPSGKILWTYGHPAQTGSAPGYLHEPDDAYLLKNGNVTVADASNCRVLVINPSGTVVNQIGTTGLCVHRPPTGLAGPNGDTPLSDGNLLVSETKGSYISEYTMTGSLVWTTHLGIGYPSDPQQLGPNLYLCADYENPGGIIEFNRSGQILYEYRAPSGINRLNQPSLVELLPSGVFMVNDDYRDRMAAIDPDTQALVWDYGVPDVPGTAPGSLNTPDGFDLLNPDGSTPTHPQTG